MLQEYEAVLDRPVPPAEAQRMSRKFARGGLTLAGDTSPLLPAKAEFEGSNRARLAICEGRYHQAGASTTR